MCEGRDIFGKKEKDNPFIIEDGGEGRESLRNSFRGDDNNREEGREGTMG